MTIGIEKTRADMLIRDEQLSRETRNFTVVVVIVAAALFGFGVAIGVYFEPKHALAPAVVI